MTLRRLKTYTGGQGYVYQYYFVGKRAALADAAEAPASEYIFDVTSDRKTTFAVSVFLQSEAMRAWAARHGRELNEAEQYGAVKMRLFQAFDEIEDLMANGRRLLVSEESLEDATGKLGVE
jgi:glutathione S-transferase